MIFVTVIYKVVFRYTIVGEYIYSMFVAIMDYKNIVQGIQNFMGKQPQMGIINFLQPQAMTTLEFLFLSPTQWKSLDVVEGLAGAAGRRNLSIFISFWKSPTYQDS